jgi:hypothetical protein
VARRTTARTAAVTATQKMILASIAVAFLIWESKCGSGQPTEQFQEWR